jgi:tRNA(adenine34) deaminase
MREKDTDWMRLCLKLGKQALLAGEAPVGSVLIKNGKVIGSGMEAAKSKNDITCHAEIEAIRDAMLQGQTDLTDAVLYTTHEPCLMCSYVIRHHKIARVSIGIPVPEVGGYTSYLPVLTTRKVPHWGPPPEITLGILQAECEQLDEEFRSTRK